MPNRRDNSAAFVDLMSCWPRELHPVTGEKFVTGNVNLTVQMQDSVDERPDSMTCVVARVTGKFQTAGGATAAGDMAVGRDVPLWTWEETWPAMVGRGHKRAG